ncbi:MAG TPA: hypothetical protein PLQ00_10410, partial [Thermoguttaceae bacterium]|nr:hypothetical protein [Thermoguttaceae bacterium]
MQRYGWTALGWVVVLGALLGLPQIEVVQAQEGPIVLPPQQSPETPAPSPPQVQPPLVPSPYADPANAVQDLLRRGYQLESEGRWGDALLHYEESLRTFPAHPSLQRRYEYARLHYDLVRRYNDRSFLRTLQTLSPQE